MGDKLLLNLGAKFQRLSIKGKITEPWLAETEGIFS